jgi:hypothetical protein
MTEVTLTHIGGPTVLLEVEGWRLLTDPTFDAPGRRYTFGCGSPPTRPAARRSPPPTWARSMWSCSATTTTATTSTTPAGPCSRWPGSSSPPPPGPGGWAATPAASNHGRPSGWRPSSALARRWSSTGPAWRSVARPPARSACAPPPSARRNARRPTCRSGPGTVRRCSPTGGPIRCWSGETSRSTAGAASASARSPPRYPRPRAAHVVRTRVRRRPPGQLGFRCQCSALLTHSKRFAEPLASCPQTYVSATTQADPTQARSPASRTRVRNQRRTTTTLGGLCDTRGHGPPPRLRPHLDRRPTPRPSGRCAQGGRLLPGLRRHRQRRPRRPAGAGPDPRPAYRHVGSRVSSLRGA